MVLDIDDDKINRHFNDKRMGTDVDGEVLSNVKMADNAISPDLKGYTLRITGGNDK